MHHTPMFDVLSLLFEYLQSRDGIPSRESIFTHLMAEGCEQQEIGCAVRCMDVLFYPFTTANESRELSSSSIRIFNLEEQNILPDEVRGLLHFLSKTGNLDMNECEFIIRALMDLPPEEITVDNAKLLTLIRLWGSECDLPPNVDHALFDIFDERGVLH